MGFQQGLSGLNASAKHLDTIGNNVANASTVGFKQSQAQFADMFAASLSGSGGLQIGTGTKLAAVAQQFTQGNITNTSNPLDTAISGQGFFRLTDASGAALYSRNGQFQVDKNGFLVNNQGHTVSGYLPNATGLIAATAPVPLQLNSADLSPNMTTTAIVGANLDSRSAIPLNPVFSSIDPTSYTSSTSLSVYDSLGASHVGTLYFQRLPITPPTLVGPNTTTSATLSTAAGLAIGNTITFSLPVPAQTATITGIAGNVVSFAALGFAPGAGALITTNAPSSNWNTYLTVDGAAVAGATTPQLATLTFDLLGKLSSTTPVSAPVGRVSTAALFPTSTTVSTTQTLAFDFGSPTAATTQFGGTFGVNTLTQNGYTSGRLNSTSTSADGTILGRYSNGQSRAMGQIVLANFTNSQGLQPVGNNEWVETSSSGGPLVGAPGSSSLGVLQSSATEDSNVDLTAELVNMITAQRVYQANAQTIKTQDQLLQTIVSLR
ncbi:MAG: flagellar hook protein FlgE [Gallionella sp.]|nr:flagellar hook protein FlgE [Gallionella sp.]